VLPGKGIGASGSKDLLTKVFLLIRGSVLRSMSYIAPLGANGNSKKVRLGPSMAPGVVSRGQSLILYIGRTRAIDTVWGGGRRTHTSHDVNWNSTCGGTEVALTLWPKYLLQNKALNREIERRAEKLQSNLEAWKQNPDAGRDSNPQMIWRSFKQAITDKAKALAKVDHNRIKHKIIALQSAVSAMENEPTINESQEVREEASSMREEYEQLLRKER
jgi:hypothetical protein